jgi:hypothetical protein
MIKRFALVAIAIGVLVGVTSPASATMPRAADETVTVMPLAPAQQSQTAAAARYSCGAARYTSWGGGQVCVRMAGSSGVWQFRIASLRGHCVTGYYLNNRTGRWQATSPRVTSCTAGGWVTREVGTLSHPTSGARMYGAGRYGCLPLPPGWGGCW